MTDIVLLIGTLIGMFIIFYFGYKILKKDWNINLKVVLILLLIFVISFAYAGVSFAIIKALGLQN